MLITKRYLRRYSRQPATLVLAVAEPVMFVLMFRYVFGGAIRVPGGNYVEYLMPGIIGQTVAFASMGTAVALAEDITTGIVDRFRSMPISRSAVLVGRLAWDVIEYSAVIMMMIAIGYLVGFRFANGVVPAVGMLLLALVFGLSMSCVSAFVGMRIRRPEAVASFGLTWLFPLCFISSAFVPVATMPGWLRPVANANPVSVVIETMRSMALGGPIASHLIESLIWLALIVAVFVPMSVRAYKRAA
jgi:ABC transporter DrrB family efflux protein